MTNTFKKQKMTKISQMLMGMVILRVLKLMGWQKKKRKHALTKNIAKNYRTLMVLMDSVDHIPDGKTKITLTNNLTKSDQYFR